MQVVEERLRVAAVTAHDVEQKEQDSFDTNIASSHISGITLFEAFPGDQEVCRTKSQILSFEFLSQPRSGCRLNALN